MRALWQTTWRPGRTPLPSPRHSSRLDPQAPIPYMVGRSRRPAISSTATPSAPTTSTSPSSSSGAAAGPSRRSRASSSTMSRHLRRRQRGRRLSRLDVAGHAARRLSRIERRSSLAGHASPAGARHRSCPASPPASGRSSSTRRARSTGRRPPTVARVIKGVKVYDPRLDSTYPGGSGSCRALDEATYVYSENPWLHALTFALGRFQNGKRVMGVGMPIASIDVAAFVEAANIADANGWKAAAPSPRPTTNGTCSRCWRRPAAASACSSAPSSPASSTRRASAWPPSPAPTSSAGLGHRDAGPARPDQRRHPAHPVRGAWLGGHPARCRPRRHLPDRGRRRAHPRDRLSAGPGRRPGRAARRLRHRQRARVRPDHAAAEANLDGVQARRLPHLDIPELGLVSQPCIDLNRELEPATAHRDADPALGDHGQARIGRWARPARRRRRRL
jgi:hypothetical protein